MTPEILLPIARHILQAVAGMLMAAGYIAPEGTDKFVTDGMTAAGGLLSIASIYWMLKAKKAAPQAMQPPTNDQAGKTLPAIIAAALLAFGLLGCAKIAPGNDPVVVNAERTTQLAYDVFDTFTLWEFTNRQALAKTPEIRQAADFVRLKAPDWLATARAVTKAYKQNRTAENKANVQTALAVLRAGIKSAQAYLEPVRVSDPPAN